MKRYLLYLITIAVVFSFVFSSFIFFNKNFVFYNDSYYAYIPYRFLSLVNFKYLGGFLYQYGLGINSFALKMVNQDPFVLLYILLGLDHVEYWFYISIFKLLLIVFFIYKTLSIYTKDSLIGFIFSMFFAFSGVFLYWIQTDSNFTAILFIVIQFYGYIKLRQHNSKLAFIICSIPSFSFTSIYWGINFNIFLFFGSLILYTLSKKYSDYLVLKRLLICYVVIFLICAWSLLPELYVLAHNPRVGGSDIKELALSLYTFDSYSQFILRGVSDNLIPVKYLLVSAFSGYLWFSSIFINILALAYILTLPKRYILNFVVGVIVFFSLLPVISLLFNGFSQNRLRWTWFCEFPIFILAIKYLLESRDIKSLRLSIIIWITSVLIAFIYQVIIHDDIISYALNISNLVLWILVLVLLFSTFIKLRFRFYIFGILFLLLNIFNAHVFFNETPTIETGITEAYGYKDRTIDYINHVDPVSANNFFRVDKEYYMINDCDYCGLNENLIQGYYDTKSYSNQSPTYINFSRDMQTKPYYNFVFGFNQRYNILKMLGVKYIVSHDEISNDSYTLESIWNGNYIYKQKTYDIIGHVFHSKISLTDFLNIADINIKDKVFSNCGILNDLDYTQTNLEPYTLKQCIIDKNDKTEPFVLKSITPYTIMGDINLLTDGVLFLPIPFDYGFTAYVDGKVVKVLNINDGFIGINLSTGKHEVILRYLSPMFKLGIIVSLVSYLLLFIYFLVHIIGNKNRRL